MNFNEVQKIFEEAGCSHQCQKESDWHPHPYGGGWVQNTCDVGKEVFIGQNVVVWGKAKIRGELKIEDRVFVGGNANLNGWGLIHEEASIAGNTFIWGEIRIGGRTVIR